MGSDKNVKIGGGQNKFATHLFNAQILHRGNSLQIQQSDKVSDDSDSGSKKDSVQLQPDIVDPQESNKL